MPTPLDHFNPRPPKTTLKGRYILLAVIVHIFLVVALSLNINWRSESPPPVMVGLWTEPELPQPKVEKPQEKEKPVVTPPVQPQVENTTDLDAEIALQKKREELRLAAEKARQEDIARIEKEKQKAAQEEAEQLKEEKRKAAEKEAERLKEIERQKEITRQKEIQRQEKIRQDQIRAMQDALGDPNGNSTSGSSKGDGGTGNSTAAYAQKLANHVRQKIVYTGDKTQNIETEVYFEIDSKGKIKPESIRLMKSSGNSQWDNAVLDAVRISDTLPPDANRKYPDTSFKFKFKPRDK